ncbi:MAG: MBL fold metallo-hydrolase [Candidatus Helarchaeota archaeon]
MRIRWLGTAALEIKTGSTVILMDPWLSRFKNAYPAAPEINRDMIKKANYIFITHGHFDHFADTPYIVEKTGAKVFVSKQSAEIAIEKKGLNKDLVVVATGGDRFELEDFNVEVIHGKHIKFDAITILSKLFRGGTYKLMFSKKDILGWKKGEVLGWAFELFVEKNKLRVTIFGSLGYAEDLFKGKEYSTDILIVPVAGRRDAWRNVMKYIEKFKPKLIIPTHYDDSFPPLSDWYINQVEKIEEILKEKYPDIQLKRLELNQETEIII